MAPSRRMRQLALRRIKQRRLAAAQDPAKLAEIKKLEEEGHLVFYFPEFDFIYVIMNLGDKSKRRQAPSGDEGHVNP